MSGKKQKEKKEKKKTKGFKASACKIADEAERANENLEQANETLRVVAGVAQEVQGQVHELQQQVHDGAQAARNQVDALNERVDGVQETVDSLLETMQDVINLLQLGMERAELTAAQTNEYAGRLELITKFGVVKGELHANQLKMLKLEVEKLQSMLLTGAGQTKYVAGTLLLETIGNGLLAGETVIAGGMTVSIGQGLVGAIAAGTAGPILAASAGLISMMYIPYYFGNKLVEDIGWEGIKDVATFGGTRRALRNAAGKVMETKHQIDTKIEERRSCHELLKNLHDDIKRQLGMVPVSQHRVAH